MHPSKTNQKNLIQLHHHHHHHTNQSNSNSFQTPSPTDLTPLATHTDHSNLDYLNVKPFNSSESNLSINTPSQSSLSFDSQPTTPSTELSSHHQHSSSPTPAPTRNKLNSINLHQNSSKPTPAPTREKRHSTKSSPSDPSSSPRSWPEASVQPDHQLTITLFSARQLQIPPQRATLIRPYAVLEFDQTESVTDDASGEPQTDSVKRPPKWRGFKRAVDGYKSPIHTVTTRRPDFSSTTSYDSSTANRLYATSTSRSRTPSSSAEEPVWNHTATFDVLEPSPSVYISIYDRAASDSDLADEGFLGGTVISLETGSMVPQEGNRVVLEEWVDIFDAAAEKCCGAVRVRIEFGRTPVAQRDARVGLEHFEVIKLIGEGSYGQVFRVRKKDTKRVYAMKVLNKQRILKDGQQTLQHVLAERQILIKTRSCPFLVGLKFSFQSPDDLHLVMDLKSGGELMSYMQRYGGRFPEPWVVFYTAEILSGLSFLHSMDIVYRDLKPENCLLDATGHVALCDFGLSKMNMKADSSTRTFCGTTEYIAPEILMENGYTRAVDFWALGVLIFEMTVGWTPFFSEDRVTKYSLILESDISAKIPKRGVEETTRDIILHLLERDPEKRLGSILGSEEIKTHAFFKTIEWTNILNRRLRPPFRPRVESDADVHQRVYEPSSFKMMPSRRSSVDNSHPHPSAEAFRNFTFSRNTSGSSLAPLGFDQNDEPAHDSHWQRDSFKEIGFRSELMDEERSFGGGAAVGRGIVDGCRVSRVGNRMGMGMGYDRRSSEVGYLT